MLRPASHWFWVISSFCLPVPASADISGDALSLLPTFSSGSSVQSPLSLHRRIQRPGATVVSVSLDTAPNLGSATARLKASFGSQRLSAWRLYEDHNGLRAQSLCGWEPVHGMRGDRPRSGAMMLPLVTAQLRLRDRVACNARHTGVGGVVDPRHFGGEAQKWFAVASADRTSRS